MTDDDIVRRILRYEGGFVDHPADKAGATNRGITATTLGDWRKLGRPATAAEVRGLGETEAIAIYRDLYIAKPGFDRVADPALRLILVDAGVLHGPARAVRWLQQALAVTADGELGPRTLAALAKADPARLRRQILASRYAFFGNILAANPSQKVFAAGWYARVTDLLLDAA